VCWAALSAGDLGWGPLDGGSPSGNFSHPSQWGSLGDPGWDTERLTSRYGSAVLRPITPRRQAPTRHRPHLAPPYATPNPFCLPRLHDKPQSQRQRNWEGQREEERGLPPPLLGAWAISRTTGTEPGPQQRAPCSRALPWPGSNPLPTRAGLRPGEQEQGSPKHPSKSTPNLPPPQLSPAGQGEGLCPAQGRGVRDSQ